MTLMRSLETVVSVRAMIGVSSWVCLIEVLKGGKERDALGVERRTRRTEPLV
jgi:hypothetical protein